MALRRSLTARAKFFYQQQQRLAVPLSHVARHDNDDRLRPSDRGGECLRRRIPGDYWGSFSGSRNLFGDLRFAIPAAYAPVFVRNMSTDGVDVVGEKAVEAVVVPVAKPLRRATFWWASIAVTTILIRTLLLPLTIHQLKALSKFKRIRPQVLEIHHAETESSDKSPVALALHRAQMKKLLNEYGINRFTNLASSVTQFIVVLSLYTAIVNMAGKIESFKHGGAFWFTDLTTLDAMHILPFLTTWTFWKALQAVLCYWITSNLYGHACGMVMKKPEVQKMLGIPNIAGKRYSYSRLLVLPASFGEWLTVILLLFYPIKSI